MLLMIPMSWKMSEVMRVLAIKNYLCEREVGLLLRELCKAQFLGSLTESDICSCQKIEQNNENWIVFGRNPL